MMCATTLRRFSSAMSSSHGSNGDETEHRRLGEKQLERTFVAVKPDGVQRGLVGDVLMRFERRGLKMVGLKMALPSRDLAERHYEEHRDRDFFERACRFLCGTFAASPRPSDRPFAEKDGMHARTHTIAGGPVVASVWEGYGAIKSVRAVCGKTDPLDSPPGTIRGDLGLHWRRNVVHSSDSPESAAREIDLWFEPHETVQWDQNVAHWISELPNAPVAFQGGRDGHPYDPLEHPGHMRGVPGVTNEELPFHR